jgi:hypothetical protein
MSVAGQQNAYHGSQTETDAERDADRAERVLFDLIFSVVNQIFRRAAAPLGGALRRFDPVFYRVGDRFFHLLNYASELNSGAAGFSYFFKHFAFHCRSSVD